MREFTPEELDVVRRAAASGETKTDTMKVVRIGFDQFARLCAKHGIKFAKHQTPPPPTPKRHLTPEQEVEFRKMVANGSTTLQLSVTFGVSKSTVRRFLVDLGLNSRLSPKNNGRNPMRSLQQWKPAVAFGELEEAVLRLRKTGLAVFSEDVVRHPAKPPPRYSEETKFVVGNRKGVTAAELVAMA